MKRFIKWFLTLAVIGLSAGCSKGFISENANKELQVTGDYQLYSIHWPGLAQNLDGDDKDHWELTEEFKNMIGYYEPDYILHVGVGTTSKSGIQFGFHFVVPYPVYTLLDNGDYHCSGINTFKQTIYVKEVPGETLKGEVFPFHREDEDYFMSWIEKIGVYEFEKYEDEIWVGVQCSLPTLSERKQIMDYNYLYFKFKKV